MDWIQLGIVSITEVFFLIDDAKQYENMKTIAAVATFILWSQSLFYLRAFKSTGKFVSMVIAMVIDIRFFVLILGIFVLATANAYFLLFAGCDVGNGDTDCDSGWDTVSNTIYSSINMLIYGDFDLEAIDGTKEIRVARTLFVVSEFMVAVVLLNLLIAIMGATYETISEKEDVEFYKLRASSLVELESFLGKDAFEAGLFFPNVLPRGESESESNTQLVVQDSRPTAVTLPVMKTIVKTLNDDGVPREAGNGFGPRKNATLQWSPEWFVPAAQEEATAELEVAAVPCSQRVWKHAWDS